jgi:hypothetical protein
VQYQAPGAVQIRWTQYNASQPAWDNLTTVSGPCLAGDVVDVSVTVSNASGAAPPAYDSAYCPEPPCPKICPIEPLVDGGAGRDGRAGRRDGLY